MIKMELEGFDEVQKMFEKLGTTGDKYFQDALTQTADIGASAMKLSCPVKTSRLRSSIHHETPNTKGSSDYKFRLVLTGLSAAFGTNVTYAEDVNYGTKPHIIEPVNAKALRFVINNNIVFAKRVRHPGTRGAGFFEKGEKAALDALENRLAVNYDKAIKELT